METTTTTAAEAVVESTTTTSAPVPGAGGTGSDTGAGADAGSGGDSGTGVDSGSGSGQGSSSGLGGSGTGAVANGTSEVPETGGEALLVPGLFLGLAGAFARRLARR